LLKEFIEADGAWGIEKIYYKCIAYLKIESTKETPLTYKQLCERDTEERRK